MKIGCAEGRSLLLFYLFWCVCPVVCTPGDNFYTGGLGKGGMISRMGRALFWTTLPVRRSCRLPSCLDSIGSAGSPVPLAPGPPSTVALSPWLPCCPAGKHQLLLRWCCRRPPAHRRQVHPLRASLLIDIGPAQCCIRCLNREPADVPCRGGLQRWVAPSSGTIHSRRVSSG